VVEWSKVPVILQALPSSGSWLEAPSEACPSNLAPGQDTMGTLRFVHFDKQPQFGNLSGVTTASEYLTGRLLCPPLYVLFPRESQGSGIKGIDGEDLGSRPTLRPQAVRRLAPRPLRQDRRVSEAVSAAREPVYTRLVGENPGSGNQVIILTDCSELENSTMKTAGIDVSHKTVTLVISREGKTAKPRECKNTPRGTRPWSTACARPR